MAVGGVPAYEYKVELDTNYINAQASVSLTVADDVAAGGDSLCCDVAVAGGCGDSCWCGGVGYT